MLWKLPSRAFRILLGILFGLGDLPLDRFWRHVSYMFSVNDAASGGSVEENFFIVRKRMSFALGIDGGHTCILVGGMSGMSIGALFLE